MLLLFEPTRNWLARHAKGTLKPTETQPLMIGSQNLFTALERALYFGIECTVPIARIAPKLLLASIGATALENIQPGAFGTFEYARVIIL